MKSLLLSLPLACALLSAPSASAQSWNPYDYYAEAAAHGLDSVDYMGYAYYMEWGTQPHRSQPQTPFRYEPSAGAPVFVNNPGFESGDFTGWTGTIGDNTVNSAGPLQNVAPGIFTGAVNPSVSSSTDRHSIMQLPGAGNDAEGNIPTVPAGYGSNTALLGNATANYQGQTLEQTWIVSASDTAFVISYAVVMYDGSHPTGEGSYFNIELLDSTQTAIFTRHDESNALPATYMPAVSSNTNYLPWERDTFDLSPYAGQSVTLRFTTAGCIWGGHYCYAYIDCDPDTVNTVSITETGHASAHVHVYPNPSSNGVYNVSAENKSDTPPVVVDVAGRVVSATYTATANGWIVDLSNAASGSYILCVTTAEGISRTTLLR